MTAKLKATLKRELEIDGRPYVVAITPVGLRLTAKGRRKGHELSWRDFIGGEAALAVALNASLAHSVDLKSRQAPAEKAAKVTGSKSRRRKHAGRA